MRRECGNCENFTCEVTCGGRPLERRGECQRSKTERKFVEADDFCNRHRFAEWANEEGGAE